MTTPETRDLQFAQSPPGTHSELWATSATSVTLPPNVIVCKSIPLKCITMLDIAIYINPHTWLCITVHNYRDL